MRMSRRVTTFDEKSPTLRKLEYSLAVLSSRSGGSVLQRSPRAPTFHLATFDFVTSLLPHFLTFFLSTYFVLLLGTFCFDNARPTPSRRPGVVHGFARS